MAVWIALFILALGAMFLIAYTGGTIAGLDSTTFGYVIFCIALLVYLAGGMLSQYSGRATPFLRDAVTWLALGLGLVTVYTYRETLLPMAGRVAGELIPGSAMTVEESSSGATEIRLRKRMDCHFVANVQVNGKSVSMIVDTGASEIVLRPEDAEKLGIDTTKLSYSIPVHTANGRSMTARVRLDNVAIGPLDRQKVDALIAKPGALTQSLLGMSFLSRLRSYEFSGDFLTLRG